MTSVEDIWTILEGIREGIETLTIDEKCIICNKLLIDAFQGPCGCNYCRKCIESNLSKGNNVCPGASKDCLKEQLVREKNIVKDNAADRRVSRLKMECPHESCKFSADLYQLVDHLRTCISKPIVCPLTEIGCVALPMGCTEISDHLTKDVYEHSLLLVEWIKYIRNEMTIWKDKKEIGSSEKELINKTQLREIIAFEIMNHEKNKPKTDIVYQNFRKETDSIKQEIKEMRTIIDEMKDERKKFEKQMSDCKMEMEKEIGELRNELKELKKVSPYGITQSVTIKKDWSAAFSWEINMSPQARKNTNYIMTSQKFYSTNNEYEMKLNAFPAGCGLKNGHQKSHLCIKFCINVASNSSQVRWPTNCIVIIGLFNKIEPNKKILIEKTYCMVDPKDAIITDENYYFHCANTEIDKKELIHRNSIQIFCSIDPI